MKQSKKIAAVLLAVFGLLAFWYWADGRDYFNTAYNDPAPEQQKVFEWQEHDSAAKLMGRYRQHFNDSMLAFPRAAAAKVKLFRNIPMFGALSGKTLKESQIPGFLQYCNDTANFDWGETTWDVSESEYVCKLYDRDGKVVGKIYFCLESCGMASARPFCPSMKFGGLSTAGREKMSAFINNQNNWE